MGHHGHALLPHRTLQPFVTHVARTACQQTGDVAFHHGTTIATGAGEMDLIWGAFTVEAGLMEDRAYVLGTGVGYDGGDRLGNAHRQNAARMERLTYAGVVEAQITRNRVYLPPRACPHTVDGVLDAVEQGQSITRIARIAVRHQRGKDKTGGGFRSDAGLAAKLHRTIALAFEHGGNGGIVGMDQLRM